MKNLKRIIETAKQLPLQERGPYLRNSIPNADRGLSMFLAGTALENRDLVWAWRICRQSPFKDLAQDGDIHTKTAAEMFGVTYNQVTKAQYKPPMFFF